MVGLQYGQKDPRRDAGVTYFYMGVNLGACIGPLVAGWLGERWLAPGFASAAVGMAFGLIQFAYGQDRFGITGLPPAAKAGPPAAARLDARGALSLAAIPFVYAVLAMLP